VTALCIKQLHSTKIAVDTDHFSTMTKPCTVPEQPHETIVSVCMRKVQFVVQEKIYISTNLLRWLTP